MSAKSSAPATAPIASPPDPQRAYPAARHLREVPPDEWSACCRRSLRQVLMAKPHQLRTAQLPGSMVVCALDSSATRGGLPP